MPVEIKELVIRTVVDYSSEEGEIDTANASMPLEQDTSAIIQSCVKQVLKILKQEQKR